MLPFAVSCTSDPDQAIVAQVNIVHLSPDSPPLDFYINSKVQVSALPYSRQAGTSNSPYIAFTKPDQAPYIVETKVSGSSATLVQRTPNWQNGKRYTLATYDTLSGLKLLELEDDGSTVSEGKAQLRVANIVARLSASGLSVSLDARALFSDLAFGTVSGYQEVDAGSYVLNAEAGGAALSAAPVPIALRSGKRYTVFARGIKGLPSTNSKAFGYSVLLNN
jgi:hypothetical protein